MITDIQNLLDRYQEWLSEKTKLRQVKDRVEITTPYLDRHNDYIQVYVRPQNGGYLISDEGYTLQDLIQSGCNLDSKKRRDLLNTTLNGFGVRLERDAIMVLASQNNFALKKHNLLQAILAVNDLFYLSVPTIASLFIEDVTSWLDMIEARYIANVKFTGASGFDHVFDFAIAHSKKYPDRFIRAINRPSRETAESFAWAWVDTKEIRPESLAYAILNDTESPPPSIVVSAFRSYDILPFLWSQKESMVEPLAS